VLAFSFPFPSRFDLNLSLPSLPSAISSLHFDEHTTSSIHSQLSSSFSSTRRRRGRALSLSLNSPSSAPSSASFHLIFPSSLLLLRSLLFADTSSSSFACLHQYPSPPLLTSLNMDQAKLLKLQQSVRIGSFPSIDPLPSLPFTSLVFDSFPTISTTTSLSPSFSLHLYHHHHQTFSLTSLLSLCSLPLSSLFLALLRSPLSLSTSSLLPSLHHHQ